MHTFESFVCQMNHVLDFNFFDRVVTYRDKLAVHPEHLRSLLSTCMDALMPQRHECLKVAMTSRYTVHSEHRRSLPSTCMDALMPQRHGCLRVAMTSRYTVHPEHRRSLPSMTSRHTVHPEHKKPGICLALVNIRKVLLHVC